MINNILVIFTGAAITLLFGNTYSAPSNSPHSEDTHVNIPASDEGYIAMDDQPIKSIRRYYTGILASNVNDDTSDNTVLTWIGRFGIHINEYFAIEGRLGLPTDVSDTCPFNPCDEAIEIDKLYGVYGAVHSKISDLISAHGLIGYTRVGVTYYVNDVAINSTDEYELSFGLGLDVFVRDYWSLNVEYIQYLDNSEFDINETIIGATYYF